MSSGDVNTLFCRELLRRVMEEVRPLTTAQERKDVWTYRFIRDHHEFHGPEGFYWHGNADNKWDARAQGWSRWLESKDADERRRRLVAGQQKSR